MGFFFLPVSAAAEWISAKTCSEMDIVLDLWISTIYNDKQVQGSEILPCSKTKYKLYPLSNACGEDIILRGRESVTRNRIGDNPLYHDTWQLLKKYRDVVWNLETYYWLLYDSFLFPQQFKNVDKVIEKLRPYIRDISYRTYYRKRREAMEDAQILAQFFPEESE